MNHHSADVAASVRDREEAEPERTVEGAAQRAEDGQLGQYRQQPGHPTPVRAGPGAGRSPPRAEVGALQRRRERRHEEDHERETEQARRLPNVVRRRERFSGRRERVSLEPEPGGERW